MADLTIELKPILNDVHLTRVDGKTLQLIMVAEKSVPFVDQDDTMHASQSFKRNSI